MSMVKTLTVYLVLVAIILVLVLVNTGLILTLPREPTTVTMPLTIPSPVTVTVSGVPGATVTIEKTVLSTVTVPGPGVLQPISIALLLMGAGNPYWDAWAKGVEDAVNKLNQFGIKASYTYFDGKYDPKIQYDQVLAAVGRYNVIILTPVDRVGLQPAIEQARAAGVLVIVADNAVERDDLMDPFIGSNNLAAAELEAKALLQALRESGNQKPWKILIIHGVTTAANNVLRLMGYYNVLKPYIANGTVKIVDVQCGYDTADKAYSVTLSVLARERFDAVLSTNDAQAIGAIRAIEAAGLTPGKDVIVVGLDGIPEAIEAIKEGKMYATVAQTPYIMGYWSVFLAFYRLYFGFDPVKASGGNNWVVTPTPVITRENVHMFESLTKAELTLQLPTEQTAKVKPVSDVMGLINALKGGS
ncbi:MAG: sugar ABC transporter substrate-binding protein [Ignisphaera sp.]